MTPQVSVIVPCYNVQDYLAQCLDSFVRDAARLGDQVILVDDGSTDQTPALCDRYGAEWPCVQVIHQENGGLSAARNTGMEAAAGEYLQFVDSDDWLEPDALEQIHRALESDPDVLLVNVYRYREGQRTRAAGWSSGMLQNGWESLLAGYAHGYEVNGQAQGLVLRRSVVEQAELTFHEGILHEDMEWTPLALCACQNGRVLEEPVYAYRLARQGSIMAGLDEKALSRRQQSCVEAARVLAGAASQQQGGRRACLAHGAGLVFSQALGYAARQSEQALHQLAQETRQDVLLRAASRQMPRRWMLYTRLRGLEKGTYALLKKQGLA